MRVILFTALFIITIASWSGVFSVSKVRAQSPSDQLTVLIIDRQSIQKDQVNVDLINSFGELFFKLKNSESFMFIPMDDPSIVIGPTATNSNTNDSHNDLGKVLREPPTGNSDLVATLAEVYNLLSHLGANAESVIYIVTGSESNTNAPIVASKLQPVLNLYSKAGWAVYTIALPTTNQNLKNILQNISNVTIGESYTLTIPDGMKHFADRTLRLEGKGALTELGNGALDPDTVLAMNLNIAPGTEETNIMFFKDNEVTALRLKNPDGFEASAGDRTSSTITELPNLIMWQLVEPIAGQWQVEIRGIRGEISVWIYSKNKYTLGLVDVGTIPLDQPTTITGYINDGPERSFVEGARLSAKITSPEGLSIIHELNDAGIDGDAISRDGYYAATIPPLTDAGEHLVKLELTWPGFEHSINIDSAFDAQYFPALHMTPENTELLLPGIRVKIATIFANVGGQPYSVLAEDITLDLVTNADELGIIELIPQSVITKGRAFMYDVYYTPSAEASATIIMRLNVDYARHSYTYTTDSLVISSHQPKPTPLPMPVSIVPTVAPVLPQTPSSTEVSNTNNQFTPVIVTAVILGILVSIMVIYWSTRPKPYGHIYDDQGALLVDFSKIRRSPIVNLLSRSIIRGDQLNIRGLNGVTFNFKSSGIIMSSTQVAPATVRVNNRPLIGERLIGDNAWIGTSGRLYNFTIQNADITQN